MTFENFMLRTAYGTQVKAVAVNRDLKAPSDILICMPSGYFNSPTDTVKNFTKAYSSWSVHGIRIETVNDQPTICVSLYPN